MEFNDLEKNIMRFRMISNSLKMLIGVGFKSHSEYGVSIACKYGTLELVNFIKYYESFLGFVEERQKKLVLDLFPLLTEIFDNKIALERTRNNWVGHLKDKGDFIEEFIIKPDKDIPSDPSVFLMMFYGVIYFLEGVEQIFPEESEKIRNEFVKDQDEIMREYKFNEEIFVQKLKGKIELVNKKLELDNALFTINSDNL